MDQDPAFDPAALTTGSSVLAGGLWQALSQVVPQFYTLAVSIAAARFLGPHDMGRQSFIAFVELSLILILSTGLITALMRYAGELVGRGRADSLPALVRWAWRVQLVGAAVGAAILAGAAVAGAEPTAAWLLVAVSCALSVQHAVPTALLIGLQRWREASIVGLVTGAFGAVAAIVVLAAGGGITGLFAVGTVITAINLLGTQLFARRALHRLESEERHPDPALDMRRPVARFALVTSAGVVATYVVSRRSELFFLQRYSTESEIAFYSIVFAAVTALLRTPEALASALTPAVATLFGAGAMDRIHSGFARALRLLLFASIPMTATAIVLGPLLLRVAYGAEYEATGSVFLLSIPVFPLLPLIALSTALLEGLGKLAVPFAAYGIAAVVDIALAAALIPDYGADGAAVANVAAQLALGAVLLFYSRRLVGPLDLAPGALARTTAASIGAALAALVPVTTLGGALGLALGAAAAAAVFAMLAILLRIVPGEDADWLSSALRGRVGRAVARAVQLCARPMPTPP